MSQTAPDIQNHDLGNCSHAPDWTWDWELIWRGSWVVPNFVPLLSSSSTAPDSKSSASSSFNRQTLNFQKKATLDTRQQIVFHGKDGVKLQPTVTEFSGIVLATPKKRSCKNISRSKNTLTAEQDKSFSPSKPLSSPFSKRSLASDAPTPVIKEDTEMHLISKFHLTSFPTYLLAPGCTRPCRIFVDPDAKDSTNFFEELMDDDDVSDIRARFQLGERKPIGRVGLLVSVVSRNNPNTKRKTFPSSVSKQENNPFLNGSPAGAVETSVDMKEEAQRKLLRESSMFLIYAALDNGDDLEFTDSRHDAFDASGHPTVIPIISYYAYPLVDPSQLLGMTLLNPGMINLYQQTGSAAAKEPLVGSFSYFEDDDPTVESILNGNNNDMDSEASQFYTEVDEDEASWMELSLLESLDRSRIWSPYTVLAPKDTVNGTLDRSFSRSQTMDVVSASTKDGQRRLSNTLSRHRSEGNYNQHTSEQSSTERRNAAVRKGIGRLKSPSRAPQQPLDLSTKNLRRKLLGPGPIRKSLGGHVESVASIPAGLKSPSRRKSASSNTSQMNMATAVLPDLTTMMMMKKRQNASLAVDASPFVANCNPLTSPSARLSSMPRHTSTTQESLGSISLTRPKSSSSLLSTLQSIRDHDNEQQESRTDVLEKVTSPGALTKSQSSSSYKSKAPSASLPTDLPSTSKSIESRNKTTIQGLTKSILSKINIGPDHEDYKECAANLYRSVKFAMRKDIATKLYHLEELERLMDRHAALL